MTVRTLLCVLLCVVLIGAWAAPIAAQAPASTGAPGPVQAAGDETQRAARLGRAWTALGAGRAAEAERLADALLKAAPRDHEALAVKIHAQTGAGQPLEALTSYERWLGPSPTEDVFLLAPIAAGILRGERDDTDPRSRMRALGFLVRAGDAAARRELEGAATAAQPSLEADAALAREGSQAAVRRLEDRLAAPSIRDKSAVIRALSRANATGSAEAMQGLLADSSPPTRLEAARALGELGAKSAIPQLRAALKDPEGPVRVLAAAALARMGDAEGLAFLQPLVNSPAAEVRLLAIEHQAAGRPDGDWVGVASSLLAGEDPLVRLRAARLLARHAADPSAGVRVLTAALADDNVAVRNAAAELVNDLPPEALGSNIPELRRLLRDQAAAVRIQAAGALIGLAR